MNNQKNEKILLDQKSYEELYATQGSSMLKLEAEIMGTLGEERKKLLFAILASTIKLTQVIGVVAGFGFTGLGKVNFLPLFLFGEALLLTAIILGIVWVQKIYLSNDKSLDNETERVKKIFRPYRKLLISIFSQPKIENDRVVLDRNSIWGLINEKMR